MEYNLEDRLQLINELINNGKSKEAYDMLDAIPKKLKTDYVYFAMGVIIANGELSEKSNFLSRYFDYSDPLNNLAIEFLTRAYQLGNENARYMLGKFLSERILNLKTYKDNFCKTIELLEPLAEKGHLNAIHKLAILYSHGYSENDKISLDDIFTLNPGKDFIKCFKYTKISVENGFNDLLLTLGELYEYGLGTEKNIQLAIKYYALSVKCTGNLWGNKKIRHLKNIYKGVL